uniref:CCHC-type domain-containing protein n=1 Tax=Glossina morsitans morsitans TaxID=37546 RepID=A0A1B0GAC0_GLOMM
MPKELLKISFQKKNITDGDSLPAKDLTVDVNTSSSNSPTAPSISNPIAMDTNSDPSCATPNLYGEDETGESFIFVEVSPNDASKPFRLNSDLFFFEFIKDFKLKGLTTIKTISNGKAKLSFATPAEANEFVLNNDFRTKPIKVIPKTFTEKFGIVKNIPPAIKDEDFLKFAISDIQILSTTKEGFKQQKSLIPTNSLKGGFKVEYFIPSTKLCYKCGRFGHIAKVCKSKEGRCLNCGKMTAYPKNSCLETKCLGCGSNEHSFGIVKNIPPAIKDEDFLKFAISDIQILSVKRLQRRDSNNKKVFIPTNSLKVGFKGKTIPKYIKYNYCYIPVEYFIRSTKLCYKCGRFGHIAKVCKSKEGRCLNCGKMTAYPKNSCLETKCLGCGSNEHSVTSRNCSRRKKEENLKKILTIYWRTMTLTSRQSTETPQ